jgi:hypothetical protein
LVLGQSHGFIIKNARLDIPFETNDIARNGDDDHPNTGQCHSKTSVKNKKGSLLHRGYILLSGTRISYALNTLRLNQFKRILVNRNNGITKKTHTDGFI